MTSRVRSVLVLAVSIPSSSAAAPDPMDRWRVDLAVGPSISLRPLEDCSHSGGNMEPAEAPTYTTIAPQLARAVTPDGRGSVLLPVPAFEAIHAGTMVSVPVGFRYEVPLHGRLSLRLEIEAGYAVYWAHAASESRSLTCSPGDFWANQNDGMWFVAPAIGLDYLLTPRWHFGVMPIGLPILVGDVEPSLSQRLWTARWRVLVSAGATF